MITGETIDCGSDACGRRDRTWAGVTVSVTLERISEAVEWSSERADPMLVVNLGGTTSRLEARLGGEGFYEGAPTRGEISIIPAGSRFGGVYQGDIVRYADVVVDSSALCEADRGEGDGRTIPLRAGLGVRNPFLFGCVDELARLVGREDAQSNLLAECIATSLKLYLLRSYACDGSKLQAPRGLSAPALAKVQAFIADNLDQPLTLEILAASAEAPVHRLVAGFRSALGTSPARYVLAQRIRRARWLLAHTMMSLAEIAYTCGLSSQSHLTTAFRNATGLTPAAFRQQSTSDG